ncbi:MAG: SDR family NAD(P)-dependent oxidoreductase [Kiritimatiellia bacterium]
MIREKFDLTGRTAFVTGSARGIGRAIAAGLAEFGAHLVLHGTKPSAPLDEALALVRQWDARAFAVTGDLSSNDAIGDLFVQMAAQGVSAPDILVCNASTQKNVPWNEISAEDACTQMQVNFHATLRLFQTVYPSMKAKGWGRMIVVGSVQELRPHPLMAVYAASKSAQENLVRNLARQISREGITVNNLCPGVFATDRNRDALSNPVYAEKVMNAIPLHDYARPEDAAGTAVLLASDAGRYITGTTILIDGGLRLPG